jgi:excisionase family DNA binding protein
MTSDGPRPADLRLLPAAPPDVPLLLTVEEAAAALHVPASWLRGKVAEHAVECTRLGRHVRFTHEQLHALIANSAQPVVSRPATGLTRRSRRTG